MPLSFSLFYTVQPVSYTHLDVYKRQAYTIPIFLAAAIVLLAVVKFPAGWQYCIQKNWNGPQNFAGIFFFYLILFLVSFLIGPVLFFAIYTSSCKTKVLTFKA